ncbi:MAG: hypothetical protein IPK97_08490 [Ahniella sp.]|nr:hypothetical protein [Ahniella sp.]
MPAMWALADRQQAGRGLELAPERAKDWLMQLAQTGDSEAHWRLFGMASEQSIDGNAVRHLRLAAQAGHAIALAAYFERLEQGQILPDVPQEAQRDLELARRHNIQISDDLTNRLTPKLAAPMTRASPPAATEPAMADLGARMATMQTHIDELLGETRTLRDELRKRDQW